MTSLIKKTVLAFILATGAFIALIFVFGSADPLKIAVASKSPLFRHETVPTTAAALSHTNITAEIAKQIALEITAKNPTGPNTGEQVGLETIDPEELTRKALATALEEIRIEDLRPVVATGDLTIIKSSDSKTEEIYINALWRVMKLNFPNTLDINKTDPAQTNFSAFDAAFGKSISELYQLATPQTLAHFHVDIISLLGALRNVFSLIKNYESDPFQAAVAMEAGDQFGFELKKVFDEINEYIISHHLTLTY